jgi:hypothetical protein
MKNYFINVNGARMEDADKMSVFEALIIVLQLWSLFSVVISLTYMVFVVHFKNGQWRNSWNGAIMMALSPLLYVFSKNDTMKRKILVLGIHFFSLAILYLTVRVLP